MPEQPGSPPQVGGLPGVKIAKADPVRVGLRGAPRMLEGVDRLKVRLGVGGIGRPRRRHTSPDPGSRVAATCATASVTLALNHAGRESF